MLERKEKGITPVIAIALLLLITVGAVGVFWGTVQDYLGGQQAQRTQQNLQQVQNLKISMSGQKTGDDAIGIRFDKTSGGGVYNVSQMNLEYKTQSVTSWLGWSQFQTVQGVSFTTNPPQNCLTDNEGLAGTSSVMNQLNSTSIVSCNTTVSWPSSGESVSFRLSYSAGSLTKDFTFTCKPTSSASNFC